MGTCTIKTKIFLPGLFSLLTTLIPVQQGFAEAGDQTISRDEMVIAVTRGTYLFSTGNIDNPEMIFTPNFVRHEQQYLNPEAKMEDISKLIESQRDIYKVEDIQTEPLDIIVDVKTNRAALRWSVDVKRLPTADTEFPEQMKFTGITISRFEGGRIAEQWVYYDSNMVLTLTRMRYKDYFESTKSKAE